MEFFIIFDMNLRQSSQAVARLPILRDDGGAVDLGNCVPQIVHLIVVDATEFGN